MLVKLYSMLILFDVAGRIDGRKKLQKTVHLLQSAGIPYEMSFKYHYYGPYSADLQSTVNELVAHGLVSEETCGDTYSYEITEKGKDFISKYRESVSDSFELPSGLLQQLLSYPTNVLELASTYGYLLDMGYDKSAAQTKALKLKPHLAGHFGEAAKLLDDLDIRQ